MHLSNLKLKKQLVLLISIGISMMIIVQLFYYFQFFYLIQDKTEVYVSNTVNQANDNLKSTTENIKKAANSAGYNMAMQDYFNERDMAVKVIQTNSIINLLRVITESNACIADVAIIDKDGSYFSANSVFNSNILVNLKAQVNFSEIDKPFYSSIIQKSESLADEAYFCYLSPIYNTYVSWNPDRKLGICVVLCKVKYLQNIVKNTSITKNSIFCMLDNSNKIVAFNTNAVIEKEITRFIDPLNDDLNIKSSYDGKASLVRVKVNQDMKWKMVSIIPINELTVDLQPIKLFGIIMGVITFILLALVGMIFSRSITKPIAMLVKSMSEIGHKNLKQRIVMKETNEIGTIAKNVNIMLDKIESMTDNIFRMQTKLYEVELTKKEAELSALQSQINPHFLYNTLECIRSIGLVKRVNEIVSISTSMAKIFRYSIKGSVYTTVIQEIDCIRDYLSIMSIRYGNKFKVLINVDPGLFDLKIIKMILQPIVENAVYHGLETKEDEGMLEIRGEISNDHIIFTIMDDGIGMIDEEVERINSYFEIKEELKGMLISNTRCIGLTNINNRIRLYYGDAFGIRIFSKKNEGTKVVIELPLL